MFSVKGEGPEMIPLRFRLCLLGLALPVLAFALGMIQAQPQPGVLPPERVVVNPVAAQKPAANTDAVATLSQFAGRRWELTRVGWSYSATPTAGQLIIAWTDTGAVARSETYYITAAGPGELHWPDGSPLTLPADVSPTITLKAGGAAVSGSVYYMAKKN